MGHSAHISAWLSGSRSPNLLHYLGCLRAVSIYSVLGVAPCELIMIFA